MKKKPQKTIQGLRKRLRDSGNAALFDAVDFYDKNTELVEKYINKNTYEFEVPDYDLESIPSHWWYKGSEGILRANIKDRQLSLVQKLEWIKCCYDIVYFVKKYIKIISIDDGVIPFELWDYQEDLLIKYHNNRFVISLQARQSGKTQVSASYITHFSIFNDAKYIAIVAQLTGQAQEILERVQMSYENLPLFLQPGVKAYSKRSMTLSNKSKIGCFSSTSSSLRGKSCVSGETKITVRNKTTGLIEKITMDDLKFRLNIDNLIFNSLQNQSYIDNKGYEVYTPSGWSDFEGLVINHERETISLDDYELVCTPCHRIKVDDEFIECEKLAHTKHSESQDVYDLFNVEKNNEYYTNSVVSHNCALVFIDECAFLSNDMKFYESTYPTISSGKESRVLIASTPNGMRGLFYKLWTEAVEGVNSFVTAKVTWDMVPGRDEAWKAETIANTSEEQFEQEQNVVFAGSQKSLLNSKTLESLLRKKPIIQSDEGIKVFKEPIKNHEYIMTVDVSRGVGGDYHSFTIVDISSDPHDVVCTFKNNMMSTLYYPHLIHQYATNYNQAFVLVEINDIGEQVANTIYYDLEYENLLTTTNDKSKQVIGFSGGQSLRMGVRTDKRVKSIGCSNAKTFIEKKRINLNDEGIINEFGTFVPKGGSYAADSGATDDQVMTIILYAWAMTQPYFIDLTNQDSRKKVIQKIQEEREDDIMPFGIIDNGVFEAYTGDFNNNGWNS